MLQGDDRLGRSTLFTSSGLFWNVKITPGYISHLLGSHTPDLLCPLPTGSRG